MKPDDKSSFDLVTKFAHDVKHHVMIAEELAKALRDVEPGESRRVLDRLERTLRRLLVETSSVLLTGKFEAGLLKSAPMDLQLNDVVRECLEEMRILFESSGKNAEFTPTNDLPLIKADPALLPSVINNLLDNALKYGGADSPVQIWTGHFPGEKMVRLTVTSKGPPLGEAEAPNLFKRFHRAANSAGKPGTGLGLYLVRQIVTAHGGVVSLIECGAETTSIEVSLPTA